MPPLSVPPLALETGNRKLETVFVTLTINGEPRALPDGLTVAALVQHLGMKGDRIAIERNREIVARDRWATVVLSEGDRLEIVHFVGGGSCGRRLCKRRAPG